MTASPLQIWALFASKLGYIWTSRTENIPTKNIVYRGRKLIMCELMLFHVNAQIVLCEVCLLEFITDFVVLAHFVFLDDT